MLLLGLCENERLLSHFHEFKNIQDRLDDLARRWAIVARVDGLDRFLNPPHLGSVGRCIIHALPKERDLLFLEICQVLP